MIKITVYERITNIVDGKVITMIESIVVTIVGNPILPITPVQYTNGF